MGVPPRRGTDAAFSLSLAGRPPASRAILQAATGVTRGTVKSEPARRRAASSAPPTSAVPANGSALPRAPTNAPTVRQSMVPRNLPTDSPKSRRGWSSFLVRQSMWSTSKSPEMTATVPSTLLHIRTASTTDTSSADTLSRHARKTCMSSSSCLATEAWTASVMPGGTRTSRGTRPTFRSTARARAGSSRYFASGDFPDPARTPATPAPPSRRTVELTAWRMSVRSLPGSGSFTRGRTAFVAGRTGESNTMTTFMPVPSP